MSKIQICHMAPHSLYNRSNSPPLSPPLSSSSPLALSSPPLSLHLLFATCMGNRFSHLSAWLFNLFDGILLRFLGHVFMFFHLFCLAGSALSDWHALMSPKVKWKRLKVWHLNAVPAGGVFTYTWPTHTHTHKMKWFQHSVRDYV